MSARRRAGLWLVAALLAPAFASPALAQTGANPCATPFDDVGEPCPDLTITKAESSLGDDRVLTITAFVVNQGAIASEETDLTAASNEAGRGKAIVPPMDVSETPTPVEIPIPVPPGFSGGTEYLLRVDPSNRLSEEDEFNNDFAYEVEIPPTVTTTTTVTTTATTRTTTTERITTQEQTSPPETLDGEPTEATSPRVWVIGGIVLGLLVAFGALRLASRRRVRPGPSPKPPPPEVPPEAPTVPPPRPVRTGFSSPERPGVPLDVDTTLGAGSRALFWIELGDAAPASIPEGTGGLTGEPSSRLDVTLAPLGRGPRIEIADGAGELVLRPNGEAGVARQPEHPSQQLPLPPDLLEQRLLFDLRTPLEPGTYRMRCGIYHRQTLVQSRVVTAAVTSSPEPRHEALRSEVDYSLSSSLSPAHLAALPSHRVSLMLNHSGGDSHDLLVLGEGGLRLDLPFDAQELQQLIRITREGLRLASWASEAEWDLSKPYRYETPSPERLRLDLASMAVRGAVVFAKILAATASYAGQEAAVRLQDLLRAPGPIQVPLGRSARRVFPAALVYDHLGLDTTLPLEAFELCGSFVAAREAGMPLETSVCFTTGCDTPGKKDVVCPSGFWGYRHELGLPVSELATDARSTIDYRVAPAITVAVSTDARLTVRPVHEQTLQAIWGDGEWHHADTRDEAIRAFRERAAHIVYLYCHGGVTALEEPYVQVGPLNEPAITASVLAGERVRWSEPRPLVFINGCHTTSLEPEKAFELVSPLVALHGAVGVVGTEITVFEPLARDFAEACFRRFLEGTTLGEAIRGARLDLLAEGNPLGLVYIPFALPGLRLRQVGPA